MRVYELANQLGVPSRDVLLLLEELGVGGKTASSSVSQEYVRLIRARLGGEAVEEEAKGAEPEEARPAEEQEVAAESPVSTEQEAAGEQKSIVSVTPSPPETVDIEELVAEQEELVRLKAPVTVGDFATALDTDAENIVRAAADLGETINEEAVIPTELAMLIGEQWGYTIEIEEPEVIESPEPPVEELEPTVIEEEGAEVEVKPPKPKTAREKAAEQAPPIKTIRRIEAPADAPQKAPVVTILGHVDHGKTTLLDGIRETNVTAEEPGAITQHIGAYQVEVNGRPITFIDTPGHEAFTAMRARGAQVTDIAILVVGADDGPMPQTFEAIDHAQAAGVPIIVAVNKIDRPSANVDAVKQRLSEKGLVPEEWGGETIYVPISALEKRGIEDLLEMILLVADMRELRAERDKSAEGVVLEAELDKRRGSVATLLVQKGTLKQGDSIVAGPVAGKVRAMLDDRGRRLKEAGPSTPVQIIGFSDVPEASEIFRVVESDKVARTLAEEQSQLFRESQLSVGTGSSMEDLAQLFAAGEAKTLNIILKADAHGTVEAIAGAVVQIGSDEVAPNILHTGVGNVTESDVSLAAATKPTVILGFQVGADAQARRLAVDEGVEIRLYEVIYDLLDDVRDTLTGMLEVKREQVVTGRAEVRALFQSSRMGTIAGCYVLDGQIVRGAIARVRRKGEVVYEGRISSMRHHEQDVTEMSQGFECGIVLGSFNDMQVEDIIECVEERELRRSIL